MARRNRRYAYGPYVDGPDPLAPPFDLRAAMDEIGRDVMEGASPRTALQELLRRGMENRRGLDELTREVYQRRSRLQRENRLDGTLQEVRELLQRALDAERDSLGRQDTDDARFREMQLDALPSDTGGAVRELGEYDCPEGGTMEHGATADADCTFLFVTNKAFDIHHVPTESG